MVKVKICGLTNADDARAAVDAGATVIGLNFYPPSPRYVDLEAAERIVKVIPKDVWTVGVFVDADRAAVQRVVDAVGLDAVQFHGNEGPEQCAGWNTKVIKVIRMRDVSSLATVGSYSTDYVLIDAYVEGIPGGTGRTVAWDRVSGVPAGRLFLAGGLTPDNVAEAVRVVRPFAVDVASGVERAPGIKDAQLMKRFVSNAQSA